MESEKYVLEPDPMHNLNEEDSKALMKYVVTHVGKPIQYEYLNNAKIIGNAIHIAYKIKKCSYE